MKQITQDLENLINHYKFKLDPSDKKRCFDLIKNNKEFFFNRSHFSDGHFTTSALLLNKPQDMVLLTHHIFLNQWLQLGGHFEEDISILDSAIREAKEESGINEIYPITTDLINIDIHHIPENKNKSEPSHFHYDLIFLLGTDVEKFKISEESLDLKWFKFDEISKFGNRSLKNSVLNAKSYLI